MKITVVGIGYVGLANAITFARNHKVCLVDIDPEKVKSVRSMISPISDEDIAKALLEEKLDLTATMNLEEGLEDSEYVIVSISTNYNESLNHFDMDGFELLISEILSINSNINIVVKSTVPYGYMDKIYSKYQCNILYAPEFLREGYALYDNLNPSRIVVGTSCEKLRLNAEKFIDLVLDCIDKKDPPVMITGFGEAESIKLFTNTYLAMRIAFFNELDTFAECQGLDTEIIIKGVCQDSRIGDFYNNPSFGYGGYCLPKDTKQLAADFKETPSVLIKSITTSNNTRKMFIFNSILKKINSSTDALSEEKCVGIYRLSIKKNVSNMREAAVIDIIKLLIDHHIKVLIYEPYIPHSIPGCECVEDFVSFIKKSNLIIANRVEKELVAVRNKVYTRDIFFRD